MKAFLFICAGAGAGEKILGAGADQKWTGSATLVAGADFYVGLVFRIRMQLNPDPAKNLHPDLDPEDLESGSKIFLNTF